MSTGSIIFTIVHLCIFFYTRIKYVRKFKKAQAERAHFEVENIQLQSKLETLETIVNAYE